MDLAELDQALLAAHARDDIPDLVRLYTLAADLREVDGAVDAACFYLTHAFIFALEIGAPEAEHLKERLVLHGRA